MKFLVTRPLPDCHRTAAKLRSFGHEAVEEPMLTMRVTLPIDLPAKDYSGVVVTSARVAGVLTASPIAERLKHLPVFAVGDRSAHAMQEAGWQDVRSAQGAVDDLERLILDHKPVGPLLYLAARDRAGGLENVLGEAGLSCDLVEAYAMEPVACLSARVADDIKAGRYDGVLIYSARTGETFLRAAQKTGVADALRDVPVYAISQSAGNSLEGWTCVIAPAVPTEEALLNIALNPH